MNPLLHFPMGIAAPPSPGIKAMSDNMPPRQDFGFCPSCSCIARLKSRGCCSAPSNLKPNRSCSSSSPAQLRQTPHSEQPDSPTPQPHSLDGKNMEYWVKLSRVRIGRYKMELCFLYHSKNNSKNHLRFRSHKDKFYHFLFLLCHFCEIKRPNFTIVNRFSFLNEH